MPFAKTENNQRIHHKWRYEGQICPPFEISEPARYYYLLCWQFSSTDTLFCLFMVHNHELNF